MGDYEAPGIVRTMTPEISSLADWTELCELCDWDETWAATLLEAVKLHSVNLMPKGRKLELCKAIISRQPLIDQKSQASYTAAEA